MFLISRKDRTVPGKIKQTFTYVHARMQDNIKGVRSFSMKPQSDRSRGRTGTSRGSHHFLGVFKIKGPICRWKVCKEDVNSAWLIRQAIGWMTNDEQLARALSDRCSNCGYGSGEWTRGASSSGGLGRNGAVFPPRRVASVLRNIKRKVIDQRVVSAVELESGGPTAELPELWNQPNYKEYWDDVNGGFLDPQLVREARLLELDWIKKKKVYDYRTRAEVEKKGIKPILLIWVDTNKGRQEHAVCTKPDLRARVQKKGPERGGVFGA